MCHVALKQVFSHFGVDYFRPAEEEFLLEYVKILRPIAEALDVLQADIKIYLSDTYCQLLPF